MARFPRVGGGEFEIEDLSGAQTNTVLLVGASGTIHRIHTIILIDRSGAANTVVVEGQTGPTDILAVELAASGEVVLPFKNALVLGDDQDLRIDSDASIYVCIEFEAVQQ